MNTQSRFPATNQVQSNTPAMTGDSIIPTEEQPLYFLHIPKTAGTTLYNTMDDRFEVEHICPDRFLPQLLRRSPDSLRHYRFFRGHFGDSLKHFVDRPLTYVTVLRDPVDRCISQFNDVRRVSNNFLYQRVNDLQMSFGDFARDDETHIAINNLQARNLAFDWVADQMDGNFNLIRRGIAGTSLGIPDDELLDIAKERLNHCTVVGILERFQETTALLSYRFCWYPIQLPRRLNQSAQRLQRETLDDATLEAVREKNQVDEALYRYAESLFDAQFNRMVADLSDSSDVIERDASDRPHHQPWVDNVDNALNPSTPPERRLEQALTPIILPALVRRYEQADVQQSAFTSVLHFSMRHPAAGNNWHGREGLDEGCTAFRWTGPGTTSTLHVPLSVSPNSDAQVRPTALTIQLYIVRAIAPDVLQSLSLSVNGTFVPLRILTQWETNTVLHGTIPCDAISTAPALTCLTLIVNRTESLQAIAPHSPDQRQVGVAVSHVCLFAEGTISPAITTLRLFPDHDELWVAVREFVRSHLKPQEAIAAPKEFLQPFPAQFQDIGTLLISEETISDEDISAETISAETIGDETIGDETIRDEGVPRAFSAPQWAIMAKHLTHQIPAPTLRWMMETMHPVFSNQVFIVLSSRPELEPVPYFADDPWSEAADFLAQRVSSGDRLAAPREFMFRVPTAEFLGDPILSRDPQDVADEAQGIGLQETGDLVDMIGKADWFVLHKGHVDQYPDEVLDRVVAELRPVFANLVFVIFSSQTAFRQLPFWSRDVRAFWKVYGRRRWLRAIQQVIQRPHPRRDRPT